MHLSYSSNFHHRTAKITGATFAWCVVSGCSVGDAVQAVWGDTRSSAAGNTNVFSATVSSVGDHTIIVEWDDGSHREVNDTLVTTENGQACSGGQ